MHDVIACLQKRGFVDALTSEEIRLVMKNPSKVYVGFDPTADSLHLGNLMGIVALGWFQRFGHTPFVILGGATGRIGDPSGKSIERPLLDSATIKYNISCIQKHFEQILDFSNAATRPVILNNDDWFSEYKLIEFLRDTGKHFRVSGMLAKESVRSRLESEEGMSFTEFCYQLLQAYDFLYLQREYGVVMQMGGSDQWGNITGGIELIRKVLAKPAYGLTFPLLTRSDGKKFGKTEEGAIWLSPERLSPYQFYQYLFGMPDADVIKLMRLLTYMEMEEIEQYEQMMKKPDYTPNTAQRRLAEEITRLVHGEEGLQTALKVTGGAKPGAETSLDPEVLKEIARDMPHVSLKEDETVGQRYVDLVVKIGFLPSKGEATRLISNGGAYLNNEKVQDPQLVIEKKDLIGGRYLLIGSGKKKKILLQTT
ncbi:MAG: tyrosine--tRNA ligase [Chlamydiales bacterium]|nr:tyrosine--tRNA ligase [Chlamydiales bacterium]